MVSSRNKVYDEVIPSTCHAEQEDSMMRLFPLTWAALHISLASAAAYLLCSTDLLNDAVFLFH